MVTFGEQSEYEIAYEAWTGDMTPEQREELRELGLDRPDRDCPQINGKTTSADDFTFLAVDNGPKISHETERSALLNAVISRIAEHRSPLLYVDCFRSALGHYGCDTLTLEEIGRRHGCTKQAAGKQRMKICDEFGLVAPRSQPARERVSRRKKTPTNWTGYVNPLGTFWRWFNRREQETPVSQWPAAVRVSVLQEMRRFVATLERLEV